MYSTFLLSLLAEIYNSLPEVGDVDQPKLVFFFDEAHLLFNNSSKAFLEQIEQVIRLIRSKGVGVFFCTQTTADIPESVLGQLGNRVQHALRAFTPNDVDALKKTVKTYPKSDFYEIDTILTQLGIGQALITVLNEKGIPTEVVATHLSPPKSVMGPLSNSDYEAILNNSELFTKYQKTIDPESAYEILNARINEKMKTDATEAEQQNENKINKSQRPEKSMIEQALNAPITRQIGREIVRGIFGMITGKKTRSGSSNLFGF